MNPTHDKVFRRVVPTVSTVPSPSVPSGIVAILSLARQHHMTHPVAVTLRCHTRIRL